MSYIKLSNNILIQDEILGQIESHTEDALTFTHRGNKVLKEILREVRKSQKIIIGFFIVMFILAYIFLGL